MERNEDVLAEIRDLYVNFYTYQGVVKAIDGIDLVIRKGETLGLVGETGCGKSVTASTIMKLVLSPPGKIESGAVYFMEPPEVRAKRMEYENRAQHWYDGLPEEERRRVVATYGLRFTGFKKKTKPVTANEVKKIVLPEKVPDGVMKEYQRRFVKASKNEPTEQDAVGRKYDILQKRIEYMQLIRGRFISMIFQEPTSALNPVFTVGDQIAEVILQHRKSEMAKRALRLPTTGAGSIILGMLKDGPVNLEVLHSTISREHGIDEAETSDAILDLKRRRFIRLTNKERVITVPKDPPVEKQKKPLSNAESAVIKAVGDGPMTIHMLYSAVSKAHGIGTDDAAAAVSSLEKRGMVAMKSARGIRAEERKSRTYRVRMLEMIANNPTAIGTFIEKVPLLRRVPYVNEHNRDLYAEAIKEATRMLDIVRIPDPRGIVSRYPYELSGGMQQRVMIAMALACNPRLLIADEPTTALDVTIQAQILKLMKDLKSSYGSSILLITHNLGVVAEMCDRVGVMYAGSMAEIGPSRTIFKEPLHPYTTGLMKSVPSVQQDAENLFTIRGSVPNLIKPPPGCRFHPRCDYAKDLCERVKPKLVEISPDHYVACHKVTGAEGYG